jgi:uncharacterized membrane protein YebE (DUF533 family)
MNLLATICKRVGLSESELKAILKNPQSIQFTPAQNPNDRMQQLIDMVFMMMADGDIDPREMDICMQLAMKLGFKPSAVSALVQEIINKIEQSRGTQRVKVNLDAFL